MSSIASLQKDIHENAVEKGFYSQEDRPIPEMVVLMHSELSEAIEVYRERVVIGPAWCHTYYVEGKPEGFGIELADCIIRILDTAQYLGLDMEQLIQEKMAYNRTRPFMHGGKAI